METVAQKSLFERIGGMVAVNAAVNIFYEKVINDHRVRDFFSDTNLERQTAKQKSFLAYAFGAPVKYKGKNLQDAHAHLVKKGLTDTHFDAVAEHLNSTLVQLNVPTNLIEEVMVIAGSTREHVLGRIHQ
jgi:hemoglobin